MKARLVLVVLACVWPAHNLTAQDGADRITKRRVAALEARIASLNSQMGRIEEALAAFAGNEGRGTAPAPDPDRRALSEQYVEKGIADYQTGEFGQAYRDFAKAVDADPDNPRAHHNQGVLWLSARQFDRAIAELTIAISLNSKYAAALANRGRAYESKGDFASAEADYLAAARLGMDTGGALARLGACAENRDRDAPGRRYSLEDQIDTPQTGSGEPSNRVSQLREDLHAVRSGLGHANQDLISMRRETIAAGEEQAEETEEEPPPERQDRRSQIRDAIAQWADEQGYQGYKFVRLINNGQGVGPILKRATAAGALRSLYLSNGRDRQVQVRIWIDGPSRAIYYLVQ